MDLTSRSAGVLLHITSLPGEGLVGTMGDSAFRFVDFLAEAGHSVWQILPLGPPARGNSPYSALSAFAGNPLLISPGKLEEAGLLPKGSCDHFPAAAGNADYAAWARLLTPLLRRSFRANAPALSAELAAFRAEHASWLTDYAHFMALREVHGRDFRRWPRKLFLREEPALSASREALRSEIAFHQYVQYLFFTQWGALRSYAGERDVRIFGDVPIYVDIESADLWANPGLFQLGEDHRPSAVGGVPPDDFSAEGQLWGNPLYDWEGQRRTGYDWWIRRLRHAGALCDLIRIDHFRGLSCYWAVPAGSVTARDGAWVAGPGIGFLRAVGEALPHCRLVAEDLGYPDDEVRELLRESGLPGLSVLEFAFSPWEESSFLPHNITADRVAYIGTHDNDTAIGWLTSGPLDQVAYATNYMRLTGEEDHWTFLRTLYGTKAHLAVALMQDILGLGSEARMNTPSASEGSWQWRMDRIPAELAPRLRSLAQDTGRS